MKVLFFVFVLASPASATDELRLEHASESLTGAHYRYRQYVDGLPVAGAEVIFGLTEDGELRTLDEQIAIITRSTPRPGAVPVNVNGVLRYAWRTIDTVRAFERYARYVDVETGELLRVEPLFYTARARVFEVNPVARLNAPQLRDENDAAAAVPSPAYSDVDVEVAPTGPLRGPRVAIVDLEPPRRAVTDGSQSLLFDRADDGFEEVNAFFHIDRTKRHLESLGYRGAREVVAYPIPVDAHAANGSDNSFYVPGPQAGRGVLYFGDGGTDDAEDSDLVLHEFAHAIHDWIAPAALGGSPATESRALSEGFGDYWSFSENYELTVASGRDPFCIADWDTRCWTDGSAERCGYGPETDCLRRVDSTKTMAGFVVSDRAGTEHQNGEIWSSALREIFVSLVERYGLAGGKRTTDTVVVESLFGVPPNPAFRTLARRMLDADRLLYGGAHETEICTAMVSRGIVAADDCTRTPRGEWTLHPAPQHGLVIPDNNATGIVAQVMIDDERSIERAAVALDIRHPSRGDLRVTITAPDGTEVVLLAPSVDRTADVRATIGIDAPSAQSLDILHGRPANGIWTLRIADTRPADAGVLLSWGLVLQLAGDTAFTSRPLAAKRKIIPAAGSVHGANDTRFVTNLVLFNRADTARRVSLLYAPAGNAGGFAAVNVVLEPGRVVTLPDVVAGTLQSVGMGALEVSGEVDDVIVSARTYTSGRGERIPAAGADSAAGSGDPPIFVSFLASSSALRSNVGFTEISGAPGVVQVRLFDANRGVVLSEPPTAIEAFGHRHFAVTGATNMLAEITVLAGDARIIGYGSVVDNRSGDAYTTLGERSPARDRETAAPAISATGVSGRWKTDFVLTTADLVPGASEPSFSFVDAATLARRSTAVAAPNARQSVHFTDVVRAFFGLHESSGVAQMSLPRGTLATARISAAPGASTGASGQTVPWREVSDAPAVQHLIGVETSSRARTNVGIYALGDVPAEVRVSLFDGGGTLLEEETVELLPWQLRQMGVSAVAGGRVTVETVRGAVHAYASILDIRTGDAVFIPGE